MKVLLVVPPEENYIEASSHSRVDRNRESRPNLGILYVASYLIKNQPDISLKVFDCPSEKISFDQYVKIIQEYKPDLVGITALTFTIVNALKTARFTKAVNENTYVCIGGYHCTLYPRETLGQPGVDLVVFGDGEISFHELVWELKKSVPSFRDLKGIGFKRGSELIINSPRSPITDLDNLPYPGYDYVNINYYSHVLGHSPITISIQSSRGCPFGCTFCDIRRTKFRYRTAKSVVDEITHWYNNGIKSYFIVDDNFTLKKKRIFEICNEIAKRNLVIDFKISSRVDEINKNLLIALKRAGCSRINFGVESGHQKYLDYLEKGTTPLQAKKAFQLCREVGIDAFAYMMIGLFGETREEMYDEIKFLKEIKSDYASFSVCSPYPKTKLYKKLIEENVIRHDYWQTFAENPRKEFIMPLVPSNLSPREIRNIQADLTRRFYLSKRVIFKKIREIKNSRQFFNLAKIGARILIPVNNKNNI
jgi:radical SAM superfamily enzyme YgiQ (UPF0313 family)